MDIVYVNIDQFICLHKTKHHDHNHSHNVVYSNVHKRDEKQYYVRDGYVQHLYYCDYKSVTPLRNSRGRNVSCSNDKPTVA